MISKWNYLPLTSNEQQIARTLGDRYPKVPALCKLLAQRGVTSAAEAEKFFKPQLSDLHDPFLMPHYIIEKDIFDDITGKVYEVGLP